MLARTDSWPPDYDFIGTERMARALALKTTPGAIDGAKDYYATNPAAFIEDWCDTFDPRNAGTGRPTRLPFVLFNRQREFVEFLHACVTQEADGLIEKSRDMGATWLCACYSVWGFLFVPGFTVGWGSRKQLLVDSIGDMSSIFEKMRYVLRTVPPCFWPTGFSDADMSYMRIFAPDGNSITGESGDEIGRGGRTRVYFKDESAHYVHPEAIEAALGDNTRVQIDISSVNGLGNVFHRKREGGIDWEPGRDVVRGKTNVFVMDWSDHPAKTQAWYDEREAKATDEGLLHLFRQEVDRNYAASVEGVVIPAEWVKSAIDAHVKLGFVEHKIDDVFAGLDVADGGGDRNALALRKGAVLREVQEWGERDTGATARRCVAGVEGHKQVSVQYDCIGVGSGVKAEINRLGDDDLMPKGVSFVAWNAGAAVLKPDSKMDPDDYGSPLNKDFYKNLKAQAWWQLRRRFEKTHRMVEGLGTYPQEELVSLPSTLPLLRTVQKELSQPTVIKDTRLRMVIDKQPEGTRSPNLADAIVMAYWPVDDGVYSSMTWV